MHVSHLEFYPSRVIRSDEDFAVLAEVARTKPKGSLLVMMIHADGTICDTLVFDEGDRDAVGIMQSLREFIDPGNDAVLMATARGMASSRKRQASDIAAWDQVSAMLSEAGGELLEWFIVGGGPVIAMSDLAPVDLV